MSNMVTGAGIGIALAFVIFFLVTLLLCLYRKTVEYHGPVILVVGGDTEYYNARVAEDLAKGCRASTIETTKAGTRLFHGSLTKDPIVVETTTLVINGSDSIVENARHWISVNLLRGLFGKRIHVICVVVSTGPEYEVHNISWLRFLAYIFKRHQRAIMVLVRLEGTNTSEGKQSAFRDVLQKEGFERSNIIFETFEGNDLPAVQSALAESTYRGESSPTKPFILDLQDGPWEPERVILFGRKRSGKSTLARMLTKGPGDRRSKDVPTTIRDDKELELWQGRGWYVVDMPGFRETKEKSSSGSITKAVEMIKQYVKLIDGGYSHFIYVVSKDQIDALEVTLWKFLSLLFGEGIKDHFTIVITNASQSWVEENKVGLRATFEGCRSILSGNFPPSEDEDRRQLYERIESLRKLEVELALLSRPFTWCDNGQSLQETVQSDGHSSIPVLNISKDFRRLALTLMQNRKVFLLPT